MHMPRVVVGVLVLAAACASHADDPAGTSGPELAPSGLDRATPLGQLDAAQRASLCGWETEGLGGAGSTEVCQQCTGNACTEYDVTVNTVEMCLAQLDQLAGCEVTVGQAEDCIIAQAQDLCEIPAACDALAACL